MLTNELRAKYLDFFESKGCVRKPSDVLVPRNDQSVLFTPAGMNNSKTSSSASVNWNSRRRRPARSACGRETSRTWGSPRTTTRSSRCSANFSFGDYFKREAIHWAWEFLTTKKWLG